MSVDTNDPGETLKDRKQRIMLSIQSADFKTKLRQALPPDVSEERFTRTTATALNSNIDLLDCEPQSLYNAITRAAQDGLLPDGREGAIVSFNEKVQNSEPARYVQKAQWMPMVVGVIKRLAKGGIYVNTDIVCENDTFEEISGYEPTLTHKKPPLGQPRGKMIGVYACTKLPDGSRMHEVLDMDQVDRFRAASKTGKSETGPWGKWRDEMARKSALRRLSKRLPMLDDAAASFMKREAEEEGIPDDLPQNAAPTPPSNITPPTEPAQTRASALLGKLDNEGDEVLQGQQSERREPVTLDAETSTKAGPAAGTAASHF